MGRVTRRFESDDPPWGPLEEWAEEERFKLIHADDVRRQYRRGMGIGIAPMYVEVIYTSPWTHMQAWVGINLLVRPGVLFFARREWTPESGGWRLSRSRRIARESVNRLFQSFDQDVIE